MSAAATELKLPVIIAHRGASSVAPENTAASIVKATEVGAKVIEFDVRETADGELLLFHDGDLKRFFSSERTFESLSSSEAASLDVGSWFDKGDFSGERPITLGRAIQLCLEGNAIPLIERKSGSAKSYADLLRKEKVIDQVIVQAFDWDFLRELRKELPEVKFGALGSKKLDSHRWEQLQELKPDWIGWNYKDFRTADISRIHGLGAKVALWTVNDMGKVADYLKAGVDGIITDEAESGLRVLAAQ